ncbi:MAG: efflux RND transporter periplasmic adaptor subunit [Gemmatimonadota bacterium]
MATIDRRFSWLGFLPLIMFLAACGDSAEAGEGDEEAQGFTRVINVEVLPLQEETFREVIRVTGTVQAHQDVVVAAEEAGVVRELLVARGASVQRGQPLLRIDDTLLRIQLREAEAAAVLARQSWDRRRRLYEEDGAGTELSYLESRFQLEQTEATLASLTERAERTVVRAPFAGVVDERLVEVGSMVSVGSPVARIVQLDPVKVVGGVAERFAASVTVGSPARITFDVLPGEEFESQVTFVGSTVNAQNRTFEVETRLGNTSRIIKPEMVANLELTRGERDSVIAVPQEALVRVEDGFVAFVVVSENGQEVAQSRRLTLGPSQRNRVVVESGLAAGDRLVVVGQQQVAHGDQVRIVGGTNGGGQ